MQWWSKEIHVAISSGTSVVVNSTERAAELLLNEWPTEDSPKQIRARRALLQALEQPDDPDILLAAQLAFEAAAEEAGILMDAPAKSLVAATFTAPGWRRRKHSWRSADALALTAQRADIRLNDCESLASNALCSSRIGPNLISDVESIGYPHRPAYLNMCASGTHAKDEKRHCLFGRLWQRAQAELSAVHAAALEANRVRTRTESLSIEIISSGHECEPETKQTPDPHDRLVSGVGEATFHLGNLSSG
jgi:hypothetical protein